MPCSHTWNVKPNDLAHHGISVKVEIANRPNSREQGFRKIEGALLIDTGAARSSIHPDSLRHLALECVGPANVRVVGQNEERMETFRAYLRFPEFADSKGESEWEHDVWLDIISLPENHFGFGLLGRDLLFSADLLYDGRRGKVTLTFHNAE